MKRGKKYQEAVKKVDRSKNYSFVDAAQIVKDCSYAKHHEDREQDLLEVLVWPSGQDTEA